MTQEQKSEQSGVSNLEEARSILDQYVQSFAIVDEGNLFFAAAEFESAYDQQAARIKELEEKLRKARVALTVVSENGEIAGVNVDTRVARLALKEIGEG